MKKKLLSTLLAVSMTGLLGMSVLAADTDMKEHFEFGSDILIGTTLIRKGRYLVKYDAVTQQMTVLEHGKMLVQVPAAVRMVDTKFKSDAILTADTLVGLRLTGLRLGGHREELMLTDTVTLTLIEDVSLIDLQIQ